MTEFDTLFEESSTPLFDQFGESVIYTPAGGSPRTIQAIVDRGPLELVAEPGDVLAPSLEIEVLDDATEGIASSAVNTGGDTVTVSVWPGQTACVLAVVELMQQQDNGLLRLRVGG